MAQAEESQARRGELYLGEIREQPAALRRLAADRQGIEDVAREIRERGITTVRLVGHGSSDNAASLGVYAFSLLPRWTSLRDSISLAVYYGGKLDLSGSVVLALSQSGRTPDVLEYVARSRAHGAFTVAITNEVDAELAAAADAVISLSAGPERAVAATKTYVNQIAALALLAGACAGRGADLTEACLRTADLAETAIAALQGAAAEAAHSFAHVERMYVVGRGIAYSAAREIALKLTETCRVAAEGLTATDLAHGPVAALDPQFPVWAVASQDELLPMVKDASARARQAGATLVASGDAAGAIDDAAFRLPVPAAPNPLLAPVLSMVPGQLFTWALADLKGLDPDRPTGLTKVTMAH